MLLKWAPPLVSTKWLHSALSLSSSSSSQRLVKVLDCSWVLGGNGKAEYLKQRIPSAVFFDIDGVCPQGTITPHMLPTREMLSNALCNLGVQNNQHLVLYGHGNAAAPMRVWWTLRSHGIDCVSILDGNFKKWVADGFPVDATTLPADATSPPSNFQLTTESRDTVTTMDQVFANIEKKEFQLVDARSQGRFLGTDPEPRAGLESGHVPNAYNVPFNLLYKEDGTFLGHADILDRFAEAGVNAHGAPITVSCGSGLTACTLAFALHLIGKPDVKVYDGSWTEWAQSNMPIKKGPEQQH